MARVAQLRPLFPRQPAVAEFDLLAMAYRGQGNWLRAERLYQELRVDRIGDAAHWHYPLARHYELAGRPRLALEHYESAIEKDSASSAAEAIRRLRLSAPTCVLRW